MGIDVREPAVAGLFYPADPAELAGTIDEMIVAAADRVPIDRHEEVPERLKVLLAPHAGYVYSGPTAAAGYLRVADPAVTKRVERVVLLGPVHRVPIRGLAHPGCRTFRTPLGEVPVEPVPDDVRAALPQVIDSAAAHAQEHSLEVHVPFLQQVLGDFTLLPLAVGATTPQQVADVLDVLEGGDDTLVVDSTDLSHYLPYDEARRVDAETIEQILDHDDTIPTERACGAHPTNGMLLQARRRGRRPRLIEACNSGDTAGDKSRVVGYTSVTFEEPG